MIHATVIRESRPIIIGSGIAGLTTALSLPGSIVVTAGSIGAGSTDLAQGGMAAAIGAPDRVDRHADDTVSVGGGITDVAVARAIASEAPERIDWLAHLGAAFDRAPDGSVDLGREAGHSERRIVHAGGDATGAEVMRVLRLATAMRDDIELVADTMLVDLLRSGDRIAGVLTLGPDGILRAHVAPAVVLATGGIGGLYERSTNPADVTGTGLAAAIRQGAALADLEFVQFHPTALAAIDHPAPLISEALRGEGAVLVDEGGTRFMAGTHPDADLAPRDVVARAVWRRLAAGHQVGLDATGIGGDLPTRFPSAYAAATSIGVDPMTTPIPVAPAEHFHMGGIETDDHGRTSLQGLWAAGEVASTGLHGANRLASNSLIEGAVMGRRVASSITGTTAEPDDRIVLPADVGGRLAAGLDADRHAVRRITWDLIGIERSGSGLTEAIERLVTLPAPRSDAATVALAIASAALARTETRGAHVRLDHPRPDPGLAVRSHDTPIPVAMAPLEQRTVLAS